MRCIDADTLEKILEKIPAADIKNMGGQAYVLVKLSQVFNVIDNQPTIEPERKKGRWIKKTIKKKIENDYSCSECGRHVSLMRGYDVRLVYPFCHCGAEMLTEDKE